MDHRRGESLVMLLAAALSACSGDDGEVASLPEFVVRSAPESPAPYVPGVTALGASKMGSYSGESRVIGPFENPSFSYLSARIPATSSALMRRWLALARHFVNGVMRPSVSRAVALRTGTPKNAHS